MTIKRNEELQREQRQAKQTPKGFSDEKCESAAPLHRSAFKYSKSPQSLHNVSTNIGTSIKEVRVKLDFSRLGSTGRDYHSERKCTYDDNYISKKFTLRKMNYSQIRQEFDKINQVGIGYAS